MSPVSRPAPAIDPTAVSQEEAFAMPDASATSATLTRELAAEMFAAGDALPEANAAAGPLFTITELAAEFDITPRAIRFYEDMGLLTPARAGRNRVYTQRDRTRLKLTLRGKRLGLSLQDVKQLVDMYDSQSDTVPQLRAFLSVLDQHRRQLRQQLTDIEVTLAEISQHEERCFALLADAGHPVA